MLVDEGNKRLERAVSLMAEPTDKEATLVLSDSSALSKMVSGVQDHARGCREDVVLMKVTPRGFSAHLEFKCQERTLVFDTSSRVGYASCRLLCGSCLCLQWDAWNPI